MPARTFARDVFINCPFDREYLPFLWAIVFTVMRSGFRARSALETDDSSEDRISKIQAIIECCRYGIHDISRTETDGDPPLPRFNMPFELGLFIGAKRYGGLSQRTKRCMILDRERFRYQRFLSDIAGQDIHAHQDEIAKCIERVATWLRGQSRDRKIPGGRKIAQEFAAFHAALPAICSDRALDADELAFAEFAEIVAEYLAAPQ